MNGPITQYQKETWKTYKQAIGLQEPYCYLYGNPVKVHVPIDTATNGLMIIGAYPTAHFNVINSIRDVPVQDHLYPFSNETYFDGSSVNCVKSGRDIEDYFLNVIGISRSDCWITDLVKVFLFKTGHINKYNRLGVMMPEANRNRFGEFAQRSVSFIDREIELATPKAVVGLGTEVNSILLKRSAAKVQSAMLSSDKCEYTVDEIAYPYFPVAHPGIMMRGGKDAEKWKTALNASLKQLKRLF